MLHLNNLKMMLICFEIHDYLFFLHILTCGCNDDNVYLIISSQTLIIALMIYMLFAHAAEKKEVNRV